MKEMYLIFFIFALIKLKTTFFLWACVKKLHFVHNTIYRNVWSTKGSDFSINK